MKRQDLFVLLSDDTGQDAQKQGKQGHDETDDQDVGFQQKIGVDGRDIGKGIEKLEGNRHDPQGLIPLAQEFACPGCPENQQQNEERYRGCGPQDVRRRFRSGEKNGEGISDPVARHRQDVRRQQGKEGSCRGFPEKEDAQKKKGQMDDQRVGPEDCIEPEGICQKRLHEQTAKRETGDDRRIFPCRFYFQAGQREQGTIDEHADQVQHSPVHAMSPPVRFPLPRRSIEKVMYSR